MKKEEVASMVKELAELMCIRYEDAWERTSPDVKGSYTFEEIKACIPET